MLKSFVTCAVLSGSAAFACAQEGISTQGVTSPGAVGQAACGKGCAAKAGASRAVEPHTGIAGGEAAASAPPAIFSAETGVRGDPGRLGQNSQGVGQPPAMGMAGEYGMLTIGRQYNLSYLVLSDVADPFKGRVVGSTGNLIGDGPRIDKGVQYYGPLARGISAGASYSLKEKVDTSPAGRAWGMTVGIKAGPLTVRAAHQNLNAVRVQFTNKTSNDTVARNSILAANLRLGWGTAYAAYSLSRGWAGSPLFNPDNPYGAGLARTPSGNSRDVLVGVAVPVGARTTLLTSYIQKDDRDLANQDANQLAIGASHALSRRTDFYMAYSHMRNRNGTGFALGNAGARGNSALNIGMRHGF